MRKFLFAALLVLAACSQAPAPPAFVSKDVFALGYTTIEEAATEGIKAAVVSSTQFERAGGILQGGDGKFYYTAPVGGKNEGEVKFEIQYNSKTFKLVGLYHTHPKECELCGKDVTEFFSEMDVDMAKKFHLISFIGVLKTHAVERYNPDHDSLLMVPSGREDGTSETVSLGQQVGFF